MKYKKAITALALAALLLAGCAAPQAVQAPAPQQTAKAAETQSGVTFTDAMGYPVTVQSWMPGCMGTSIWSITTSVPKQPVSRICSRWKSKGNTA